MKLIQKKKETGILKGLIATALEYFVVVVNASPMAQTRRN